MSKVYYAAIDIGSNAVRLLIKSFDPEHGDLEPRKEQLIRVPLRLGADVFTEGEVSKKKVKALVRLMKAYKHLMAIYNVEEYRACATSAMRDAHNGSKIVDKIYKDTGIDVEIIDGREEAELISKDLLKSEALGSDDNYLYVDVGGGSTELNVLLGGTLINSESFNIGTVRILSNSVEEQEWERFHKHLDLLAEKFGELKIVGSGGNINKLLRLAMAKKPKESVGLLLVEELHRLVKELKSYSLEERISIFRLKEDRADVIVPAGEIFISVTDHLKSNAIIVPTKGLSDGIVDWLCQHFEYKKKKND